MSDVTSIMYPEQKTKMDSIAVLKKTVVRHVEKISDDLMSQLKDTSKQFSDIRLHGMKALTYKTLHSCWYLYGKWMLIFN